jgi:hypothetical protein
MTLAGEHARIVGAICCCRDEHPDAPGGVWEGAPFLVTGVEWRAHVDGTYVAAIMDGGHGECRASDCHVLRNPDRERAIRAVVAAQWAVACTLFGAPYSTEPGQEPGSMAPAAVCWQDYSADHIAALPTPEDVVDGRDFDDHADDEDGAE